MEILQFIESILIVSVMYTRFFILIKDLFFYTDDNIKLNQGDYMNKIYKSALVELNKRYDMNLISIHYYIKVICPA